MSNAIATPESFGVGRDDKGRPVVFMGGKQHVYKDKKTFCNQKIAELSARIGRPVEAVEVRQGFCNIRDTRSTERKHYDSDWRPVLSKQQTNIEKLRDETEARLPSNKYGQNRDENLLADMETMIDREAGEKVDAAERAAFLEKNAARIDKLDTLIDAENWNPNATVEMRTMLRRCREQILTEGGCRIEREKLMRSVDVVLGERATAKQMWLTQQRTLLDEKRADYDEQLADLEGEQSSLAEPAAESQSEAPAA